MRKSGFLALVAVVAGVAAADGARGQSTTFRAGPLTFGGPDGFCVVDPSRGEPHVGYWRSFTPPPERDARMLALGIDCATLELGRLQRPRTMLHLLEAGPDPRLPTDRQDALKALETRFSRPDLAAKSPPLGRDDVAVYVQQGHGGPHGGISAYTISKDGRNLIFTVIYFNAHPPITTLRTQAERAVRDLHR